MKHHSSLKNQYFPQAKSITALILFLLGIVFTGFGFKNESAIGKKGYEIKDNDSIASVKAFMDVYNVLMSPRCMNCHPAGDIPLRGDDNRLHSMLPQRGKEGKGVYAMKCSNCHQPTNIAGPNTPPGHPDWHLPPANMKMVFEGRTPGQLAKQLVDPKTNGNKTLDKLIGHADDGLVKAGWNPGEGRTVPPLSHAEFKQAWIKWIETGAFAPPTK